MSLGNAPTGTISRRRGKKENFRIVRSAIILSLAELAGGGRERGNGYVLSHRRAYRFLSERISLVGSYTTSIFANYACSRDFRADRFNYGVPLKFVARRRRRRPSP